MPGRQHRWPRHGERSSETRGRRPIRVTHDVSKATSEIPAVLDRRGAPITAMRVCPTEPKRRERANDAGKSDDRIVPLKREDQLRGTKPGNAGAGKAAKPSRDSDDPPTAPSGGSSVLERLDRITQRAERSPKRCSTTSSRCSPTSCWAGVPQAQARQGTGGRWRHGGSIRGEPAGQPAGPRSQIASAELSILNPACVARSRKGMARRGRWASPVWRTRSSNGRS